MTGTVRLLLTAVGLALMVGAITIATIDFLVIAVQTFRELG